MGTAIKNLIEKHLVKGEMLTIKEASEKYAVSSTVLKARRRRTRWSLEDVIFKYDENGIKIDRSKKYLVRGEMLTVNEACKKYNHKSSLVRDRMSKCKYSLERATADFIPRHPIPNKGDIVGHFTYTGNYKLAPGCKVRIYEVKCSCGSIVNRYNHSININSDGCGEKGCQNQRGTKNKTHGLTKSKEYRAWTGMINRCTNPNASGYEYWGGRGIKVSEEFKNSFEVFLEHVGKAPSKKHSLDRINNISGNYERGNLRWATAKEQNNNKRSPLRFKEENIELKRKIKQQEKEIKELRITLTEQSNYSGVNDD